MTHPSEQERTVRSRAGYVWLLLASVVVLALLVDVFVRSGLPLTLRIAPWLLLVVWFLWVVFASPHIQVRDGGVDVHNPLRVTEIPWSQVESITLRWQIVFHLHDGRQVAAWAAAARRPHRQGQGKGQPIDRELEILRERHAAASTSPTPAPQSPVRRRWTLPALLILTALLAWSLASLLVP